MISTFILVALAIIFVYAGRQREVSPQLILFLAVFFCAGGALAVAPDFANRVAHRLGVGRGADLLLYFAVLAGVFLTTHFYFRFRRIEKALEAVVRQVALSNPKARTTEQDS
jgi:hypothetical protein